MNAISEKLFKLKTFVSKNISFLFKSYIQLHITSLNAISKNPWLYSLYIFAIIFSQFGCFGTSNCSSIHVITMILVRYAQSSCLELYVLCRIPMTKKWIVKLVGSDYFTANFPSGTELLAKYFLPLYFLFAIDILSAFLLLHFDLGVNQVICDYYDKLYGADRLNWAAEIKYELMDKIEAMPTHQEGVVKILGGSMTYLYNYIWSKFL